MQLKEFREEVLEANLELVRGNLVVFTFGNASGFDRAVISVAAALHPQRNLCLARNKQVHKKPAWEPPRG